MEVKVKKLYDDAVLPTRASEGSAGLDLRAHNADKCNVIIDEKGNEFIAINAHQTVKIGTGLAFELPKGTFGAIFARSGLSTKQGLRPSNCTGICDSDYTGEYIVALHNDTDNVQLIKFGDRIAQLIIMEYPSVDLVEVEELSETERGDGGFGSTGKN
jgi:dUTP pyrophosphatase